MGACLPRALLGRTYDAGDMSDESAILHMRLDPALPIGVRILALKPRDGRALAGPGTIRFPGAPRCVPSLHVSQSPPPPTRSGTSIVSVPLGAAAVVLLCCWGSTLTRSWSDRLEKL